MSPPGRGTESRRQDVLDALDRIADPCSVALGRPIGLVGMGLVERLDVDDAAVTVMILPTFPDCMFRGVLEAEIEARVRELPWCRGVTVRFCPADRSWDETRMTPAARRLLGRAA
jgi:metal-sulfur cluster biosynthetic enzyme